MILPDPPAPPRVSFLKSAAYAHRGLHSGAGRLIENSLPAFSAALDHGFGIECDVQLSSDQIAYVFHDGRLDRLTLEKGWFADQTSGQLDIMKLSGDGPIPRLTALLSLVRGQQPLLIELKVARGQAVEPLCAAVRNDLRHYQGPVAIMSFHPGVSRWFATHAPEIVRGLVTTQKGRKGGWQTLRQVLAMRAARPDFLAYDIRDLPCFLPTHARANGFPVLSWTVRDEEHWQIVHDHADAAIFEGPVEGDDGQ